MDFSGQDIFYFTSNKLLKSAWHTFTTVSVTVWEEKEEENDVFEAVVEDLL